MILFIVNTGSRRAELAKVRWNDIDWDSKRVTFRDTKNGMDHTVDINIDLELILSNRQGVRNPGITYLKQADDTRYSFPGRDGKRRNLNGITEAFNRLKKKAKLPSKAQPVHCLRKFFASRLADNGVPIPSIMEMMNHKNIETTMRYIKSADEVKKKAVADLGDSLKEVNRG